MPRPRPARAPRQRPADPRPKDSRPAGPPQGLTIDKMAAGGDGLGRLQDGRVVFVPGAIAGEAVTVQLTSDKKDFARGVVASVDIGSPHRVVPPCPALADGCGGCNWQHIVPAHQGELKAEIVRDALRRTAKRTGDDVVFAGAVAPWAYRTSARLAVGADGRLGFRAAASHRVVAAGSCAVLHPALEAMLPDLRVTGADEVSLRVGAATGERSLLADVAAAGVRGCPADVGQGATALVHERVAGATLQVSAASFFQSGPDAAALLVATVRAALPQPDVLAEPGVVDAYGGVGLFSAALGLQRPVLVESSVSSTNDARVNLAAQKPTIVTAMVEQWTPQPAPLVIADPARAGLGHEAAAVLAATHAPHLVLVSCDPVAFARDVGLLAEHGYQLAAVRVLDLFPHTAHVEVVSTFLR